MDARPNWHPAPVDDYCVRLLDPGEIAAALPPLLGFRPSESVVLVGLGGRDGRRVGLTVRADIPPAEHAPAVASLLASSARTDRPHAVLVAIVSEAPDAVAEPGRGPDLPHRALLHELTVALQRIRIPVRDALLVRAGRWWSYDCPDPCCAPAAGTALPRGVTELEVASVAQGMVVENSRRDLELRIEPPASGSGGWDAVLRRAGERWAGATGERADEGWAALTEALAASAPGGATAGRRLPDDLVARVVWALQDVGMRDRALQLALGPEPSAAEALWTECTRRAPAPLDAAPATLLAVSAWLRGDGAMANVALERALDGDPGYTLARLLTGALTACLSPAELRDMLASCAVPVR
jgi:hypothetical protein